MPRKPAHSYSTGRLPCGSEYTPCARERRTFAPVSGSSARKCKSALLHFARSTSPRKRFILFDFDGVIADSYATALSVSQKMCTRITSSEYNRAFEGNVNDWKWESLPGNHVECRHDLDWFAEYVPAFEKEAQPFTGMDQIIETLSKEYVLIVISSTITSPIQGFLEKYHLGRYFSEVMGNDVHTHKQKRYEWCSRNTRHLLRSASLLQTVWEICGRRTV